MGHGRLIGSAPLESVGLLVNWAPNNYGDIAHQSFESLFKYYVSGWKVIGRWVVKKFGFKSCKTQWAINF